MCARKAIGKRMGIMRCGKDDLEKIAGMFRIEGTPVSIRPEGRGHINDTYLVECDAAERYILQRINETVFKDPDALMENIVSVTDYISRQGGGPFLMVIPAADGGSYVRSDGSCWRMMNYIDNSFSCEKSHDLQQFCEIGRAYGAFISSLSGFPAETLHNTIEHFHDTRWRFERLMDSARTDPAGRRDSVADEIRFALEHEADTDILNECVARGELPLRVTHNDTKINNVLLDRDTGKALCVIDLDTVMPGLAVTDFGDAIRSGAATGRVGDKDPGNLRLDDKDNGNLRLDDKYTGNIWLDDKDTGDISLDDKDTGNITLDLDMYRSFLRGFEEGFPEMTSAERRMLPTGVKIMALECGIRYLTDYLDGDRYFKANYPEHNLVKCRAQFRLVKEIEEKLPDGSREIK